MATSATWPSHQIFTWILLRFSHRAVMNMPARHGVQALGQGEDLPGQWHGRRTWNKINAAWSPTRSACYRSCRTSRDTTWLQQEPPEWWWAAAEAGPAPEDIPTSITSINCRHSNCHPSTAHVGKNSKVGHTAHRARCHSTSAQSGTLHAVPGPFSAPASDGGRPCTMTTARPCHLIAAATSAKAESTAAAPIGSPPSETACRVTSRTLPARARAQIQDLQCRTLTRRISGGHLREYLTTCTNILSTECEQKLFTARKILPTTCLTVLMRPNCLQTAQPANGSTPAPNTRF